MWICVLHLLSPLLLTIRKQIKCRNIPQLVGQIGSYGKRSLRDAGQAARPGLTARERLSESWSWKQLYLEKLSGVVFSGASIQRHLAKVSWKHFFQHLHISGGDVWDHVRSSRFQVKMAFYRPSCSSSLQNIWHVLYIIHWKRHQIAIALSPSFRKVYFQH